jgi:hypothetical protein
MAQTLISGKNFQKDSSSHIFSATIETFRGRNQTTRDAASKMLSAFYKRKKENIDQSKISTNLSSDEIYGIVADEVYDGNRWMQGGSKHDHDDKTKNGIMKKKSQRLGFFRANISLCKLFYK